MTSEIKPEDVKLPEPVAYMTEHEQGPMLWLDRQEALSYSDEETPPIELVPADQVRAAVLEATMAERERCAKACEDRSKNVQTANTYRGRINQAALFVADQLELCASVIRSGHSITETKRAEE